MHSHIRADVGLLALAILTHPAFIASNSKSIQRQISRSSGDTLRFAAFGDYGSAGTSEAVVAALVSSHAPDIVITTGDNSYGSSAIDVNIGQYYWNYIGNYVGSYGSGSLPNRFFPALGNHDISDGGGLGAYLAYFTLPDSGVLDTSTSGNERYYDYVRGPEPVRVWDAAGGERGSLQQGLRSDDRGGDRQVHELQVLLDQHESRHGGSRRRLHDYA